MVRQAFVGQLGAVAFARLSVGFGDQVYAFPTDWGWNWSFIDDGGGMNVVVGGYLVPDNPLDPPLGARIVVVATYPGGNTFTYGSGPGRIDHNGTHQVVAVTGKHHKGAQYTVCVRKTGGGFAKWNNFTCSAWARPAP